MAFNVQPCHLQVDYCTDRTWRRWCVQVADLRALGMPPMPPHRVATSRCSRTWCILAEIPCLCPAAYYSCALNSFVHVLMCACLLDYALHTPGITRIICLLCIRRLIVSSAVAQVHILPDGDAFLRSADKAEVPLVGTIPDAVSGELTEVLCVGCPDAPQPRNCSTQLSNTTFVINGALFMCRCSSS